MLFELRPLSVLRGFGAVFVDAHRPPFMDKIRLHMSLMRGSFEPPEPVAIREGARITSGSQMPDLHPILWTIDGCPLVTNDVLELIADATGWRTYEVTITTKEKTRIPGYRGLAVTGRCGRVVPDLDRVEWHDGHRFYVGGLIDPETYDGNDLCLPVRGARCLVSERISRELESLRLPNTQIVPLTEKKYPADDIDLMIQFRTSMFNTLSDDWLWAPSGPRRDAYAEAAKAGTA